MVKNDKEVAVPLIREPYFVEQDGKRPAVKFSFKVDPNEEQVTVKYIEKYSGLPSCDRESWFIILNEFLDLKVLCGDIASRGDVGNRAVPRLFLDLKSLLVGSHLVAYDVIWNKEVFRNRRNTFRTFKEVTAEFTIKHICMVMKQPYLDELEYVKERIFPYAPVRHLVDRHLLIGKIILPLMLDRETMSQEVAGGQYRTTNDLWVQGQLTDRELAYIYRNRAPRQWIDELKIDLANYDTMTYEELSEFYILCEEKDNNQSAPIFPILVLRLESAV